MKVVWSPLAIDRAHEEARFIAEDKVSAAMDWLDGLFAVVDQLERFPRLGRRVPELHRAKYRQLVYGSHRVVYRLDDEQVVVLTVRRFKQLLDPSEVLQ